MPTTQQQVMEETGLRHDECRTLARRGIINYENDIRLIVKRVIRFCMSTKLKALGPTDLDPDYEKARKDKELADKTALQNALTRREIVTKGFFHEFMTEAFARVRARMLAIPSKMAPIVIYLESISEAQAKLTDAVHDALNELAETTVEAASAGNELEIGSVELDGFPSGPVVRQRRAREPDVEGRS